MQFPVHTLLAPSVTSKLVYFHQKKENTENSNQTKQEYFGLNQANRINYDEVTFGREQKTKSVVKRRNKQWNISVIMNKTILEPSVLKLKGHRTENKTGVKGHIAVSSFGSEGHMTDTTEATNQKPCLLKTVNGKEDTKSSRVKVGQKTKSSTVNKGQKAKVSTVMLVTKTTGSSAV